MGNKVSRVLSLFTSVNWTIRCTYCTGLNLSCSQIGFCLSAKHLCLALSLSLLKLHPLVSPSTCLEQFCVEDLWLWFCLSAFSSMANRQVACQPALDSVVSSYYLSFFTSMVFRSFFMTSLHLRLGRPCGLGWGSQPKSTCLGMWWSGILTCPSYSSLHFITFIAIVSESPQQSLVVFGTIGIAVLITGLPRVIRTHLLWKVSDVYKEGSNFSITNNTHW